ncbi:hypothetical protein HNQ02_003191 [Flavobacterium sp. 7E]|uniref:hypothetical protein n=1 Tax=unclassified Flavobacterium TaxID=196869 RepID=UPI00156D9A03|nr:MULTISPECIES: hypothetical protein [unclassified Flavobacterium]MBE0393313.1 hypothetical protein [Flavobacterium sp. PL002]NRS90253.1 hypothetical protein [Flavobacterium sp. 7E]NRT14638.1 hypothetical protein [Flavobacterium sp. 28A]
MKERNHTATLEETIRVLKIKQTQELVVLNEQFQNVYDSVKPANLIKSTINEIVNTPNLKHNLINNLIGLSTGYLSKKIMFGGAKGPVKKVLGTVAQFFITNFVSKHSDSITNKL